MTKPTDKSSIAASDLIPIVGDAAIAGPVMEGMLVPLLILDASGRPEVDEIIRVHEPLSPGDVKYRWAEVKNKPDDVLLVLDFERPIEARVGLRFSIEKQAI